MNTINKILTIILLLLAGFYNQKVHAAPVGSGFSYQGELMDNGAPANDSYDMMFIAYDQKEGGQSAPVVPTVNGVIVSDGLFNILSIDFGDFTFTGNEVWMEISVKKSSDAGGFETLVPRQRISAVPYAVQADFATDATNATNATNADSALEADTLAAGSANLGDMLRFDGADWIPVPLSSIDQSPWIDNGADIGFSAGNVGAGTTTPARKLHVFSSTGLELARFEGGNRMFNSYYENGALKGYVGSYQDGTNAGTTGADFEIGTTANNTLGKMHLTTQSLPRLSVTGDGKIGINRTSPTARLQVDSESNENPLRVQVNGTTKLWVKSDGSTTALGELISSADLTVKGDAKQDATNNGMVKFMANIECAGPDTVINRFFNATTTIGDVTTNGIGSTGGCVITFPLDLSGRYIMVGSDNGFINAGCSISDEDLFCSVRNVVTGVLLDSEITILVY